MKGQDVAILSVSTQGQLDAAVLDVRGGDTILLSGNTYGDLTLDTGRMSHRHVDFDQKVTIASANSGDPAVISRMLLKGASNIELKGLTFDAKSGGSPFFVEGTSKITLNDARFEGPPSGQYAVGRALQLKKSDNFALLNSEISDFENGVSMSNSSNVTIANNKFRGISNDAIISGGIDGARIENNDFRDMKSSPGREHKDMIQFFTSSAEDASNNIVIRDNYIDNPEVTHAIFFGNALAKSGNLNEAYRNIVIEDNYIRSAHVHGVTIDHGVNVSIRNNTIVANGDDGYGRTVNIPIINVSKSSSNVTITGNRVESVPDEVNGSWNVSGNSTGSKSVVHWVGEGASLRASTSNAPATGVNVDAGPDVDNDSDNDSGPSPAPSPSGGNGVVRIDGRGIDGTDRYLIDDLDFSNGDRLVLAHFDENTFVDKARGNGMDFWNDKQSVKIDSAVDLQELVTFSSKISASTNGDALTLTIAQNDGTAHILFDNLGDEFRAAHHPDLF